MFRRRISGCLLDSSSLLRSQFEYVKTLPPNRLKWKQFVNQFIARESDMKFQDLMKVIACVSLAPCQEKRHDIFAICGDRFFQVKDSLSSKDKLEILENFLNAGIDICDPECKRFKAKSLSKARIVTDTLVKEFVSDCFFDSDNCPTTFLYCISLALCKGWSLPNSLDHASARLDDIVNSAILNQQDSPHICHRAQLVWSLGTLAKYSLIDPSGIARSVKRMLVETDLVPFQIGRNFINVAMASKDSFVILEQFRDGFKNLQIAEPPFLEETIKSISSCDFSIACNLIWWSAISDSRISRSLVVWTKTCLDKVDLLNENQRWKVSNGLRQLASLEERIAKLHTGEQPFSQISETERAQLYFCLEKDIFNKPKR